MDRIRWIDWIRGWNHFFVFYMIFTVVGDSGGAPVQCFFDFFMTAPYRTPTSETFLDDGLPKTLCNSKGAFFEEKKAPAATRTRQEGF